MNEGNAFSRGPLHVSDARLLTVPVRMAEESSERRGVFETCGDVSYCAVFSPSEKPLSIESYLGLMMTCQNAPQNLQSPEELSPLLVHEGDTLNLAYLLMEKAGVRAVSVFSHSGAFLGVLTLSGITDTILGERQLLVFENQELQKQILDLTKNASGWISQMEELVGFSRSIREMLSSTMLEESLLDSGIRSLTKLIGARYGAIGMLDKEGDLVQFLHTGMEEDAVARIGHLPEGKGLLGVVISEDRPICLDRIDKDPRSAGFPPNHPKMESLLAVPISSMGRVYGRVYLSDKLNREPFSKADEALVLSFAHSLALILDNRTEMELLAKAQSKLLHQAMYDPLTDLPNRKFFQDSLEQILRNKPENCDSQTFRPSFLFIDLDNFKFVNDSQGHQVGDMVLKKVGESLMLAVREGDIVSRIGGDEFAIFLDTTDAPEKLDTILRRILDAVKTPIPLSSHDVVLTASIGVAVYPDHGQTVNELMKNADLAMYEAKNSGRDTYHLFSGELEKRVRVRHDMEKNLREAISREEFCLYYQPKINMRRGEITGFEALLRWPSRNIPPSDFIGVAEESGLIVPIGEWVIETAGIMLDNFSKWGYGSYSLSVNLSVRQFWTVDFIGFLKGVLSRSHFPAHRLELEITESQLMRDTIRSAHFIRELKSMGVSVSVDDFGTGYSSLAYLKNFDLDSLKIDQSFIRDLTHDPSDRLIVRAIIAMAHGMRVGVIAEGVETLEQLAFLQHEHCDELQGFLVSRPLPEEDLLPFIKNYRLVKGALFSD